MKETVIRYSIICCDVDPDRPIFGGLDSSRSGPQVWKGAEKSFEYVDDLRCMIRAEHLSEFRLNWYMRTDRQMGDLYGDEAYCVHRFETQWKQAQEQGDGVGWHPHTWRWNEKDSCWFQEATDSQWMAKMLQEGFDMFVCAAGFRPRTARMGWAFHDDISVKTLDGLGIEADLSCVPNMECRGVGPPSSKVNIYDWIGSPNVPFHPRRTDYRHPGSSEAESLRLVEIPMTTYELRLVDDEYLRGIVPLMRKPMHKFPLSLKRPVIGRTRILFATSRPSSFKNAVTSVSVKEAVTYIGCYFHPDELIDETLRKNLQENMLWLASLGVEFINANNAIRTLKKEVVPSSCGNRGDTKRVTRRL